MTALTPTTDQVKNAAGRGYPSASAISSADFDRWLAADRRAVAAKALRDAADSIALTTTPLEKWHVAFSLRLRADRIEADDE